MGFKSAMTTGSTLLLTLALPDEPERDAELRRSALDAVRTLHQALEHREGRSEGVRVQLCVHVASATMDRSGAVTGGPIMQLTAWVPELASPGTLASAPTVDALDAGARPFEQVGAIRWFELLP